MKKITLFYLLSFCIINTSGSQPKESFSIVENFKKDLIKPYTAYYKIIWVTPAGTQEAILKDVIRLDSISKTITRLQVRFDGKIDSSVTNLVTLQPIYTLSGNSKFASLESYTYSENEVVVIQKKAGMADQLSKHAMQGRYFDGFLSEYLLGLLPLSEGYTTRIPVYSLQKKGIAYISITDVKQDVFIGDDAKAKLVYLVTTQLDENPASKGFYWIEKETGQLLKVLFQLPGQGAFVKYRI